MALLGSKIDGAAMQLDEAFDDREAKPGAAMLGAAAAAFEALENTTDLVLRNADPLILDSEDDAVSLPPAG